MSDDVEVTFDQERFLEAGRRTDWGVLVQDNQGGVDVFVCALSRARAVEILREAADAIQAGR